MRSVCSFEPLTEEEIATVVRNAVADERGFGGREIRVDDDAIAHWARTSDGDARRALTALEIAVLSQSHEAPSSARTLAPIRVDLACAEESIQRKALVYDGTGDEHYDVASAFIKSMRGGDPDATVYWLARMLEAGEDPRFIARRIGILASEDIGNADPAAIGVAAAAWSLTERVGLPECRLILAHAAIYMACAPKSDACTRAIGEATRDVREGRTLPVPDHLRDPNSSGADRAGRPRYISPHRDPDGAAEQAHPGGARRYYHPTRSGHEEPIRRRLEDSQTREGSQSPPGVSDE